MNLNPSQPDLLEAQPAPDPLAAVAALQQQTRTLWKMFHIAVGVMLLFTLGVNFYLFKQTRMVRAQLAQERVTISRMAAEFQRFQEPVFQKFAARLQAFGYNNRDFLPIMDKYRSVLESYFAPMPPLQAPALAPTTMQPKAPAPAALPPQKAGQK